MIKIDGVRASRGVSYSATQEEEKELQKAKERSDKTWLEVLQRGLDIDDKEEK